MIEIAVMGYGVVGTGVVQVLTEHAQSLARRAQEEIRVKYILVRHAYPEPPPAGAFVRSFEQICKDPDIRIVVEVMGGLHPAYEYVRQCLLAGKSVVTSNKELVSEKGADLLRVAKEHNANFLFEASVGGGVPIIRPMNQCLAANDVVGVAGILNGTTNYILTKMFRDGADFRDALAQAQALGYAERDPTADIEGADACRKICILASLAYGKHVYPSQVHTEGITKITAADVQYAESGGAVVKLIGQADLLPNGKLEVIVCPMFIPRESQLASVDDVFNGIVVRGDVTGDVMFYGKGAGKLPTASAVVADVIDCVKHLAARKYLFWEDAAPGYVEDYHAYVFRFYVRVQGNDAEKSFALAQRVFENVERLQRGNAPADECAFLTQPLAQSALDRALEQLRCQGVCAKSVIRVEPDYGNT